MGLPGQKWGHGDVQGTQEVVGCTSGEEIIPLWVGASLARTAAAVGTGGGLGRGCWDSLESPFILREILR